MASGMGENRKSVAPRHIPLFVALLFLFSCSEGLFSTSIGKIQNNPREYDGKQVTVRGIVKESDSIFFIKYFVLADDSGNITVITERILPKTGEKISVTGKVQEAFSFGDKQLIVIVESKS